MAMKIPPYHDFVGRAGMQQPLFVRPSEESVVNLTREENSNTSFCVDRTLVRLRTE